MPSIESLLDKERLDLLEVGAGIRLSRHYGMPTYNWTGTVPYHRAKTPKLVTAFVNQFWLLAGRMADYVVVYDNGGQSLPLADLVSQELTRRRKKNVGLLIVRRTKRRHGRGRWRIWYRQTPTSQPMRLRTEEDLDQIRQKTALFVVDVLEWHRKIVDVAKSARQRKNGILIAGIACLVKRDGRMRKAYLPTRIGEPVPLFCLVDRQFMPHKPPDDYDELPPGPKAEDPFTASPTLLERISRRLGRPRPSPRAAL